VNQAAGAQTAGLGNESPSGSELAAAAAMSGRLMQLVPKASANDKLRPATPQRSAAGGFDKNSFSTENNSASSYVLS
jgi:hypothetical protein